MGFLAFSLGLFIVVHLIPAIAVVKLALIEKVGRPAYIAGFSIFSLLSLGLIIYAKAQAPFVDIYEPPSWSRYFALILMLPATILIVASVVPSHIGKITRSPIFYATVLWVTAHLVANGDEASVLLFGSLGIYAFVSRYLMMKRTDLLPQAEKKIHLWADGAAVIGGGITYVTLLYLHGYIIGIDIWY